MDLSHNLIHEVGALAIANMLILNNSINVLFLHWNQLQPRGGSELARALSKNQTVQILDLSCCSLGGARGDLKKAIEEEVKVQVAQINKIKNQKSGMDPEKMEQQLNEYFKKVEEERMRAPRQSPREMLPQRVEYAQGWKECFQSNTSIVHIDFSNNSFSAHEVEVIAEGLKENHTILGIHMIGNEASVDALGFVAPERSKGKILQDGKALVFSRI